jgi:hypothetical protein
MGIFFAQYLYTFGNIGQFDIFFDAVAFGIKSEFERIGLNDE